MPGTAPGERDVEEGAGKEPGGQDPSEREEEGRGVEQDPVRDRRSGQEGPGAGREVNLTSICWEER